MRRRYFVCLLVMYFFLGTSGFSQTGFQGAKENPYIKLSQLNGKTIEDIISSLPLDKQIKKTNLHQVTDTPRVAWKRHYSYIAYDTTYTSISLSALVVDDSGNVYVTGSGGTRKYDSAGHEVWAVDFSGNDMLIDSHGYLSITGSGTAKYDRIGTQIWTSTFGGTTLVTDKTSNTYVGMAEVVSFWDDEEYPPRIVLLSYYDATKIDSYGNVEWHITDTLSIESGPGNVGRRPFAITHDERTGYVYVTCDDATIKYDSLGNRVWKKPVKGYDITLDTSGNLYIVHPLSIAKYDTGGTIQWSDDTTGGNIILLDDSGCVYTTDGSFTRKYTSDGVLLWVSPYGGKSFVLDDSGNVYIIGTIIDSVTKEDFRTVKLSRDGAMVWETFYNGPANGSDIGIAINCDSAGNVFVAGSSEESQGYSSYATIKYDESGVEQLVRRHSKEPTVSTSEQCRAEAFAVDSTGDIYVVGNCEVSYADNDIALVKYDPSGQELWSARYIPDSTFVHDMAVDRLGNIYITGSKTVSYNRDGNLRWVSDSSGYHVAVDDSLYVIIQGRYSITKMDSGGTIIWYCQSSVNWDLWISSDPHRSFVIDPSGNILTMGFETDQIVTSKYNSDGLVAWTVRDTGKPGWISLDHEGNIFLAGNCPDTGRLYRDVVIKYNSSGERQWSSSIGLSTFVEFPGIVIDGNGCIHIPYHFGLGHYVMIKRDSMGNVLQYPFQDTLLVPWYFYDTGFAPRSIEIDNLNNKYVGGYGYHGSQYTSFKLYKFEPDDLLEWEIDSYTGENVDEQAIGMRVDNKGNIYIVGTSAYGSYSEPDRSVFTVLKYEQIPTGVSERQAIPTSYKLEQNYPNPFNPSTTICYELPKASFVTLKVYNVLGQEVATLMNEKRESGRYTVEFDASGLTSGVYFYAFVAGGFVETKKLLIIR